MFHTVALLCFIVVSALGVRQGGLKVRFDSDLTRNGTTAFIELPQSESSAIEKGWVKTPRPEGLRAIEGIELWCPLDDYTTCVFIDDTGYIAGLQIGIDVDLFYGEILDWKTQGFTKWTTQVNGVTKSYWTAQQYYVTQEFLDTDPELRLQDRDPNVLLQDKVILVSGFNGELFPISTRASDITNSETSDFTKQACIDMMGLHYYYKMNDALECAADTILPWFTLIDNDQLIGAGLAVFSNYTVPETSLNWFEVSNSQILKNTVPNGPECLYQLPEASGLITMHTFFIKHPYDLKC